MSNHDETTDATAATLTYSATGPGTYATTDPDVRVHVLVDDISPTHPDMDAYTTALLDRYHEAGEVYGVIVERKDTWTNERTKETRVSWSELDAIWGCAGYADVARDVAKEYFGLTVTGEWNDQ